MEEIIKYYDIWYDYFSGDIVQYQENGQTHILCERWASTIEQYALSKLFQIPILIYIDQRYDEKKNKKRHGSSICVCSERFQVFSLPCLCFIT